MREATPRLLLLLTAVCVQGEEGGGWGYWVGGRGTEWRVLCALPSEI